MKAANRAGFTRQLAALRTRHLRKLLRDPAVVCAMYQPSGRQPTRAVGKLFVVPAGALPVPVSDGL